MFGDRCHVELEGIPLAMRAGSHVAATARYHEPGPRIRVLLGSGSRTIRIHEMSLATR
jgi:hypothetical protein